MSDSDDESRVVGRHAVDDLVGVTAHDHEPVGVITCCAPLGPVKDSAESRRNRLREAVGCSEASCCIPINSCGVFGLGRLADD